MRTWILLAAAFVAGCASPAPRPNPWAELEAPTALATRPHQTPDFPEMVQHAGQYAFVDDAGDELARFPEQLARRFIEIQTVAGGNEAIARANAEAIDELAAGWNHLIRAGAAEHELAELRLQVLEEERRARLWDRRLWAVAIAVVVGVTR